MLSKCPLALTDQVAYEVREQHDRWADRLAEAPVGEAGPPTSTNRVGAVLCTYQLLPSADEGAAAVALGICSNPCDRIHRSRWLA
jgi:hypothetical protein